jgi:hypothetical protein
VKKHDQDGYGGSHARHRLPLMLNEFGGLAFVLRELGKHIDPAGELKTRTLY